VQEITTLGLEHSLLTKYTAFVAIDSQVRNASGDSTTVRQPLPLPEGVSNLAVGGPLPAAMAMNRAAPTSVTEDSASVPDAMMQSLKSYERYEQAMPPAFPRLFLAEDELQMDLGAAMNVTPDQIGEPVLLPLSLAYGLAEPVSLGVHSREGLCVTGSGHGCAHVFDQLGTELLWRLVHRWDDSVALRLGFSFASFDPAWPRLAVGVPMQMSLGDGESFFLRFEPSFAWGLSHTETNGATFVLPLRLQLLAKRVLSIYAQGGLLASWSHINERYVIPAGLGLQLSPARWLDVGLELTVAIKAGSELPEAARRIFYDSTATITPAIYDRSLLLNFRLHGGASRAYRAIASLFADEDDDEESSYHEPAPPPPPPSPTRPVCGKIEW
jgi:hypothetical protein